MKTHTPSHEDMQARIVRFRSLRSSVPWRFQGEGISAAILNAMAPKNVFNYMGPVPAEGEARPKPLVAGGGFGAVRISVSECPPNNGAGLHVHWKARETFMALSGRWEIRWGDAGEESTELEPFDLISFEPCVTRQFTNIAKETAHILTINEFSQGQDDVIDRSYETERRLVAEFGEEAIEALKNGGWTFDVGRPDGAKEFNR